jgi:hypothetical protein
VSIFPAPVQLLESVKRVARDHPYSESAPLMMEGRVLADAGALWARLLAATPDKVSSVLGSLSRLEMRLLVASAVSRISNPRCRAILVQGFQISGDNQLQALLWEEFLLDPDDAELRSVGREIALRTRLTLWKELAASEVPAERAAEAFLGQRDAFEGWMTSDGVQLAAHERFARRVQWMLLEPPLVSQTDKRLAPAIIDLWACTAVPPDDRVGWQGRYLAGTLGNPRPHDHAVLERIITEHGLPEYQRRFWEGTRPAVIADVELWLKDRRLTEFLGEGDRVRFWRRFLPQMTGSFASGDREVVFVVFEKWFAVQFVDPGVATYLFPKSLLWSLRREAQVVRTRRRVWHLGSRALGRYAQMGDYWQVGAESEVRRVMREAENS